MTAVISPACGVAPDAIAMAIASGSATTATVNPAIASSRKNASYSPPAAIPSRISGRTAASRRA